MKSLIISITLSLSFNIIYGMGCETKPETCPSGQHKVLPESERARSPSLVNSPIKLIEEASKEKAKEKAKASANPPKVDSKASSNVVPQTKKKPKGSSLKKTSKEKKTKSKAKKKP